MRCAKCDAEIGPVVGRFVLDGAAAESPVTAVCASHVPMGRGLPDRMRFHESAAGLLSALGGLILSIHAPAPEAP